MRSCSRSKLSMVPKSMSKRGLRAVACAGAKSGILRNPCSLEKAARVSVRRESAAGRSGAPLMHDDSAGSAARARRAFARVAEEIVALRTLTISQLESKHLEILGVRSPIRSRDALIKRISLGLQRQAEAQE